MHKHRNLYTYKSGYWFLQQKKSVDIKSESLNFSFLGAASIQSPLRSWHMSENGHMSETAPFIFNILYQIVYQSE